MLNTTQKRKKQQQQTLQWELTNKALRYSYHAINLFLFLNSSNLSPTPSRVAPRNIFCTSEIKSQSSHPLLFFCLHFTQQRDNTPTCDKSTHIHQTSLKSASNRKQKDDSFIREWAREHRSLAECLSSERASGVEWKHIGSLWIYGLGHLFAPLVAVVLHYTKNFTVV